MVYTFPLDPQLAALNADAFFGPQRKAQHSYGNVFCCDFNALSDGSRDDGSGYPTCFSLFTSRSISAASYKYGYTTWCTEVAGAQSCDLSIKQSMAADLAKACLGVSLNVNDKANEDSNFSINPLYCLAQPQLAEHADQDQSPRAIKLLPDNIIPQSSNPGDDGTFNRTHMDSPIVRQYLQILWGDSPLRALISSSSNISAFCSSDDICPLLWDAKRHWQNYPTLRYQCSGGRNPTWCDYGEIDAPLKEPLAVDL